MLLNIVTLVLLTPLASALALQPRRPSGFITARTWINDAPGAVVGYLNTNGRLSTSVSDRGKFALRDTTPWTASTSSGECGFHDPNEPKNQEDNFGGGWTAFRCKQGIQIVGYPDQLGISTPVGQPQGQEYTYVLTQSGSGINQIWYSIGLPQDGEAKDVFTRGPPGVELAKGGVELIFIWETA